MNDDCAAYKKIKLGKLLEQVDCLTSKTLEDLEISAITADSRQVGPGSLFIAVPGQAVDGHNFVDEAIGRGCAAVLVEQGRYSAKGKRQAICLAVDDTQKALGTIAATFYGHPAKSMKMIAITGTNGKTTSAYLLEAVIREAGGNPGVIGTVNYRYNGIELPAPLTTPDPVALQGLLRKMADGGVTHVIMEASSHALEQKRLYGLKFDAGLFTNLSRDHLDYHGDMVSYFASKKKLFLEYLKEEGKAVVVRPENGKDERDVESAQYPWGNRLVKELLASDEWQKAARDRSAIVTCGFADTEISAVSFSEDLNGIEAELKTPLGEMHISTPLVGDFNVRNLLGVVGVAVALGIKPEVIAQGLAKAKNGAPGRLERVAPGYKAAIFVDYAHTPDALENVLRTLRKLTAGRLIVVFGCGGDRDRGKRPLMGEVAGRIADVALITSDNPRTEPPAKIVADIEQGVKRLPLPRMRAEALLQRPYLKGYDVIVSRREAIATAVRYAQQGDVVLISGKGHENYQIIGKTRRFFDDRVEARRQLAAIAW